MHYVYILFSLKDKKLYTGYSSNLRRRIKEHNNGKVESTKHRLLVKLIYYEAYKSMVDAKNRERYLKSGGNAKNTLKLQIQNSIKACS